jgi:hypothetical protein
MHSVCVVQLHVTVNYIKILSVAKHCFYGKFMSPATLCKLYIPVLQRNYVPNNLRSFDMLHINVALKQKNVCLLMAFFKCTIWLNRS